jgi:hypothetical protein
MVKSKALILCEGGNDIGFLKKFCDYLELDKKKIDIQKVSGKSNFFKENSYVTIKQKIDKGLYSKVLFIVDADYVDNDSTYGGFKNSTNELVNIIRTLDIEEKSKIFIACDPLTQEGNLEHLVLSTLEQEERDCILELLKCVLEMDVHSDKKIVLSSYEAIFKESPYNLPHNNFDELRDLLLWVYI